MNGWIINGPIVKCPNLTFFSGSWVQYRSMPLEETLGAWSKPSTSSADTRSGPWTWGMRKVLIILLYDYVLSWIKAFPHLTQLHVLSGCILDSVVSEVNPGTVLELGTYCGYSTVRIARLLPPHAKLITLELNPDFAAIARQVIAWAGLEEKVKLNVSPQTEKQYLTWCVHVRLSLQCASSSYRSS